VRIVLVYVAVALYAGPSVCDGVGGCVCTMSLCTSSFAAVYVAVLLCCCAAVLLCCCAAVLLCWLCVALRCMHACACRQQSSHSSGDDAEAAALPSQDASTVAARDVTLCWHYSTSRLSGIAVSPQFVCPSWHSLAVCSTRACQWHRCDLRNRRSVAGWDAGARRCLAVWLCCLGVTCASAA
jgi:hypothetical protein